MICFSLLDNMVGSNRKNTFLPVGPARFTHSYKGTMAELSLVPFAVMETTTATKLPEDQQVRWKTMHGTEPLSAPPAGKCTQDRKREGRRLTCKGFHFPAFQGGRRKRTKNEVRKHHGERSGNVTAVVKGAGAQEDLFKPGP